MTKKKDHLLVDVDLSGIFDGGFVNSTPVKHRHNSVNLSILEALDIVVRQMEATGLRPRTISDYETHVNHYVDVTRLTSITDVSAESVYEWLSSMKVSNQTKLTRLKCLRAFFERCAENGWLVERWWRRIKIKVDTPVKRGTAERDVQFLLSMLDLSDFVQLRDAVAILILHQTGIRLTTLSNLRNKYVDIGDKLLRIDGSLIKTHDHILLPFNDVLARLLVVLMEQNEKVRRANNTRNDYLFITRRGMKVASHKTNHTLAKRINHYKRQYGLKDFSPHALRRGFAKRLYKNDEHIVVISKALGHSNLATTTRYLHLETEEVADALRKHL